MTDTIRVRPFDVHEFASGTFSGEGGDITYRITGNIGLDVGVGAGLTGLDLEVAYNREIGGVDIDLMGALGGWAGIGSVSASVGCVLARTTLNTPHPSQNGA